MSKLTRIAVIYDGNYLQIVSNYYNFDHPRQSYISIGGLHEFIAGHVAELENADPRLCKIVDSHYFRGRLWAADAAQSPTRLYRERVMDDILMAENVTQHNLPLRHVGFGRREEKGIDVWLALETYELAVAKKFDVIVMVAADVDYVPLVRKLNALGSRVMMLGWDFRTMTEWGDERITRYSRDLAEEVSYAVPMYDLVEAGLRDNLPTIQKLFVRGLEEKVEKKEAAKTSFFPKPAVKKTEESEKQHDSLENGDAPEPPKTPIELPVDQQTGRILKIFPQGYGFIERAPMNVFFHRVHLFETEWRELSSGAEVNFTFDHENSTAEKWIARLVQLVRKKASGAVAEETVTVADLAHAVELATVAKLEPPAEPEPAPDLEPAEA